MQGLWYGDRRDRVKWGALLYLSQTCLIPHVVQVAYYRRGDDPVLKTSDGDVALSSAVWNHFSDLRHIERLGEATGIKIVVLDEPFNPLERRTYIARIVCLLTAVENPKIVFLDPDTGIEPRSPGPEHVTMDDITEVWKALSAGDILAIYQHADRTKTWLDTRAEKMSAACEGASVKAIVGKGMASDVAILWCKK